MKEEKLFQVNITPRRPIPLSASTYGLLRHQSQKLGRVAMHAFQDVKNVLQKEIPLPHGNPIKGIVLPRDTRQEAFEALKRRIARSHQTLAHVRTVFPLTLFPHSVIVDRTKVTIVKRDFFLSASAISMEIDDILNVSIVVGPLFGSLNIASRVMNSVDHFKVHHLWRSDALFLKQLIQGYVIARHNQIDTEQFSRKELIEMLWELGVDSGK